MTYPSGQRIFVAARGALYASAFLLLWGWLGFSARRFDAYLPFSVPGQARPIGWLLLASGAVIGGLCVATFVSRGQGTPAPFDPPRRFVVTGPYRYVRNPMYLGGSLMLLGYGFVLKSLSVIGLAIVFFSLAHAFVVFFEEPGLAARFGESYEDYRASVNRWLPHRPRATDVTRLSA